MNNQVSKRECHVCLETFELKDMTATKCRHFFCEDFFFEFLHFSDKNVPCADNHKMNIKYLLFKLVRLSPFEV